MSLQDTAIEAQIEQDEASAEAGFAEGFTGTPDETVSTGRQTGAAPPAAATEPKHETTPAAKVETSPVESSAIQEDIALLTKAERERLLSLPKTLEDLRVSLEQRFGTAFGKVGHLESMLKQWQSATPSGQTVTVSEEDFAELKEDFPELAKYHTAAFNRILGRLKGTGSPVTVTGIDPVEVDRRIASVADAERQVLHEEAAQELTDDIPNWQEIVGAPGSGTDYQLWLQQQPQAAQELLARTWNPRLIARSIKQFQASLDVSHQAMEQAMPGWEATVGAPESNSAYRQWLAKQPQDYQQFINGTWTPEILAGSIKLFEMEARTDQRARAPQVTDSGTTTHPQKARLAAAVQPRGTPGLRPSEPTEDDAFVAGYKEG